MRILSGAVHAGTAPPSLRVCLIVYNYIYATNVGSHYRVWVAEYKAFLIYLAPPNNISCNSLSL